ncbi:MAG: hypothetical protein ABEJ48_08210 [Halobacteriales archaeon]
MGVGEDGNGGDPTDIRTVAVRFEDLVSALEFNEQQSGTAVLRLTPPFHGRMRARLHVEQPGEYSDLAGPTPIHLPPRTFLEAASLPAYPSAEQTRRTVEDQPGEYTVDEHYDTHVESLEGWRAAVRDAVLDSTTIRTAAGATEITIRLLG